MDCVGRQSYYSQHEPLTCLNRKASYKMYCFSWTLNSIKKKNGLCWSTILLFTTRTTFLNRKASYKMYCFSWTLNSIKKINLWKKNGLCWSTILWFTTLTTHQGPSWSWSHCSWIYYLNNQCYHHWSREFWTLFMERCTRYNIMW
jgi:hypothetical protein